jgi:glutamate dehydrogenase/leucine dehydrogenase
MKLEKDPQIICELSNSQVGLKAYLVIDSFLPGGAGGGVRVREDVTLEEVVGLARAMTLKYRFLGVIPRGGAKAGIVMPLDTKPKQREKILEAFGRQVAPLIKHGVYHPWTDMNTGPCEMNQILAGAGLPPRVWRDSGYYTALTVVAALSACCDVRGLELNGLSVAVEGFGNVGSQVARELHQLGVRVVAISTMDGAVCDPSGLDIPSLLSLRKTHGSRLVHFLAERQIPRADLLEMPVDILIPAAGAWTINSLNAERVKARIIAPAANIPITRDATEILAHSDIEVLPDFVCNCGGALGSYLEEKGFETAKVRTILLEDFRAIIKDLIVRKQISEPPANTLASWLPKAPTRSFPRRATGLLAGALKRSAMASHHFIAAMRSQSH